MDNPVNRQRNKAAHCQKMPRNRENAIGVWGAIMTPKERIDENLLRVLRAGVSSGSISIIAMDDYSIGSMLKTMRDIMSESYIAGSNACHKVMTEGKYD